MNVYFIGAIVGVLFIIILAIIAVKMKSNMRKKQSILEEEKTLPELEDKEIEFDKVIDEEEE